METPRTRDAKPKRSRGALERRRRHRGSPVRGATAHPRRDRQGDRRPGDDHRPHAGRPALPRPHPLAGCARAGQDPDGPHPGADARPGVPPHPVHARPDALGHHRHGHHRGGPGDRPAQAGIPSRADLHQLPARRRDQPHAPQDPGRPVAGDAGARGLDRPAHLSAQSAVLRGRHPEPDRDGRAPIRCPRPSSTGSCSISRSSIRRSRKRC